MQSRLIYVSNEYRIQKLSNIWNVHDLWPGDYLFKISDSEVHQKELLKKVAFQYDPFLSVLCEHADFLVLKVIPKKELFKDLENNLNYDDDINDFFSKMVNYFTLKQKKCWKVGHHLLDFNDRPLIMGILNVTPDSFSDGGKYLNINNATEQAFMMVENGASIIDIGGESTRPGAEPVSISEELNRVIPVIEKISKHSNVLISIDTYKSEVAEAALQAGAHIINDISGTVFDVRMKNVVSEFQCPIIIMHIKGTPGDMQKNPEYKDLHEEIYQFLDQKSKTIGRLNNNKVIIDPGIGFGKTFEHNLELIRDLMDFTFISKPLMVGLSRKSFIGKSLQLDVNNRIIGSVSSEIYAYLSGADIIRVHDVEETVQAKSIINQILAA